MTVDSESAALLREDANGVTSGPPAASTSQTNGEVEENNFMKSIKSRILIRPVSRIRFRDHSIEYIAQAFTHVYMCIK